MTTRILTVCTGNICRSVLAEYHLRDLLPTDRFEVSSAGTHAVVGGSVPRQQIRIGVSEGLTSIMGHKPRLVTPEMLDEADLVLALAFDHRRRLARLRPSAVRKLFTLREFAALSAAVTGTSGSPIEAAAGQRGVVPVPDDPSEWEVMDPYRRSDEIYDLSAKQVLSATRSIAEYFLR